MIESAAGASKEADSGPSQPAGDRTPSHPVTLEPEKADRAERPLSSECGSPKCQITVYNVVVFLSVVLHVSCFNLLSSVLISLFFSFFFTSVLSHCCGLK